MKKGVNAAYANKIRAKRTSIDRLKEDAPMFMKQSYLHLMNVLTYIINQLKQRVIA